MKSATIRKYIELYGNFSAFRSDGQSVGLEISLNSPTDFDIVERTIHRDIWFSCEHTGIRIDQGEHGYVGFYEFPADIQAKLDAMDIAEEYAFELRQLLPAAFEMVRYYNYADTRQAFKVYGLKATNLTQTQRGTIIVCPIEGTGITDCRHRVQGYMYSVYDNTIKFDSIQAWRMRELTRDELIEFDPRWSELV